MKNIDEERCDNESEIFNTRVREDEMIITIEEYKDMKVKIENFEKVKKEYQAHVTYLEQMVKEKSNNKENIFNEMKIISEENKKLKRGIINFIKGLGG